jgi:hypothetical protein
MTNSSHYTEAGVTSLVQGHFEVDKDFASLLMRVAEESATLTNPRAKEFLVEGVARRLHILRRALQNIFTLFPPSDVRRIEDERLMDAQISLHAFVINVYGLLDNLAWAFLWRHGLEKSINRKQVGMFSPQMTPHWPNEIRHYVAATMSWFTKYLKNYRDALAHRIPLYIPPASFTKDEAARWEALEEEQLAAIQAHDWRRVDALRREEHHLGAACPMFNHSFDDSEASTMVFLHPQVLSDAKTVLQGCAVFLDHWNQPPPKPEPVGSG